MVLASEPPDWFHDFRVAYWRAGQLALSNPPAMYADLGAGEKEIAFVNLPVLALPFVPLGRLQEYDAAFVFAVISVVGAAAGWLLLCRLAGLRGPQRWLLACLFLLNGPLFHSLRHGNSTTFVLPLLAAALMGLEAHRPVWAGMLLGCAALIKPPLLLLPAYYALRRRWRVAAGATVAVLGVAGVSMLLFGVDVHGVWYQRSIAPFAGRPLAAYNVQSLTAFLARFVTKLDYGECWWPVPVGPTFQALNDMVLLAVGGATLVVCLRPAGEHREAGRLDFCLVLCLALAVSPVCWTHYFLLLLLPAALFLGGRLGVPPTGRWALAVGAAFLAMSLPVRGWSQTHYWQFILVAHPLYGALLLTATLAAARLRLGKAPACIRDAIAAGHGTAPRRVAVVPEPVQCHAG
jgi:hypothetical protein